MKFQLFTPEQAWSFPDYLAPWLARDPERDGLWYLGLTDTDRLVGMAAVAAYPESGWLRSISILPELQRRGWGRDLVLRCGQELWDSGISALRVSHEETLEDWPELDAFLTGCGLTLEDTAPTYEATLETLNRLPLARWAAERPAGDVTAIAALDGPEQHEVLHQLRRQLGRELLEEADLNHSFVCWQKQQLEAAFLLSQGELTNLWSYQAPDASPDRLALTMAAALRSAETARGGQALVTFSGATPEGLHLLEHLLPEGRTGRELRVYVRELNGREAEAITRRPRSPEAAAKRLLDFEPELMEEDQLGCAGCRHATGQLMTCGKYRTQKPGMVFYGKPCPFYEA